MRNLSTKCTVKVSVRLLLLILFLSVFSTPQNTPAADGHKPLAKIYDTSADGAAQISNALEIAKAQHKRVMLQFGANWCIWCVRLHSLFETNKGVKKLLKRDYVVVLIDVNEDHNKKIVERYGNPRRLGIPVLVVLESDGKQLTTQDTGKFEDGKGHSPEKVIAFLKEWAPKQ